jgi:uncharacterized protein YbaP (TraB family)
MKQFISIRSALILLLFFLNSTIINAQERTFEEFPMSQSSLLWKIEGEGIKKASYLFGTMHLIEKEYFIFTPKLENLVKKSDQLVMELAGLPNQLEALNLLKLKEGSFFDYFTPAQTDSILNWAKDKMKMSEESFRATISKMKPFVLVQMVVQLHFIGKTESYELSFEKIARDNKIEIIGLETLTEQMSIFDNLSKDQQSEMVMEGIRNIDQTIRMTSEMEKLYTRQNVDSLFIMIQKEGGTISEEMTNFIDQRNKNWIPKIKALIADKKTFIAVGAGHLGGPNGVIRLLQKEGYTLTPIEF